MGGQIVGRRHLLPLGGTSSLSPPAIPLDQGSLEHIPDLFFIALPKQKSATHFFCQQRFLLVALPKQKTATHFFWQHSSLI